MQITKFLLNFNLKKQWKIVFEKSMLFSVYIMLRFVVKYPVYLQCVAPGWNKFKELVHFDIMHHNYVKDKTHWSQYFNIKDTKSATLTLFGGKLSFDRNRNIHKNEFVSLALYNIWCTCI